MPTIPKKHSYPLFLLLLISCFFSCSNEFELNAPAKEIPIVYGLLSRAEPIHYIRVERAFLEEATNAIELAQQPEQLYFEDILVEIEEEGTNKRVQLQRIDGATSGLDRAAGVFATTPNILYSVNASTLPLREDASYRLNVRRQNTEEILTTAITPIVSDLRLNRPIPGVNKRALRIVEDNEVTVIWAADETAKFFDVKMHLHYEEWNPNDLNTLETKTLTWTLAKNQAAIDGANKVELPGLDFYRFLASTLSVDATRLRRLTSIDLSIDAGGEELFNYINVGQANTGITSAQVLPVYTNLSTGLGIFASRNRFLERDFVIDSATRDFLRDGELTKDLNFR